MADVSRIAAEILLSLQPILTGANVDPPRMISLEPATLQMRVCGKPCNVMAWYAPEGTIYIDSRLDVVNHMGNRSVIVHELVHHVQRMSRGSPAKSCEAWARREQETYTTQAFWLRSKGLRSGNIALQARFLRCDNRAAFEDRERSEIRSGQTALSAHAN